MNLQSVLLPAGPDGETLARLTWLLFGSGAVILLFVLGLIVLACFAAGRLERGLTSRRFILAGGVAFPIVVLSALLFYTLGVAKALNMPLPGGGEPLRIEVIGHQFWWEVRYPGALPDQPVITANEIRIPAGRDVLLDLSSADVIHSLWVPALNGKLDMIPGRVNRLRLRADRPGIMRGQCAEFCGAQHAMMAFYVVAETPEGFADWLDGQRLPVAPEQPPAAAGVLPELAAVAAQRQAGRRLFGEVGCGGCHAVRGTEWDGRIGPDLTHVGSRLSIGAGILGNHRGTLAGWIAASQDLKPGNGMPSFASALDGAELRAVAAWLESLK